MTDNTKEQKPPTPNNSRPVWELVIDDMKARDSHGRREYGTPLQVLNGRDPLIDAYQEALDLAVYLRQAIEERKARQSASPPLLEAVRDLVRLCLAVEREAQEAARVVERERIAAAVGRLAVLAKQDGLV